MGATTHSLEVNAPVGAVYGQWTKFEEFPRFMDGVVEIQRHDAKRLLWKVNIGGKDKEWEAEILEQIPDTRIVWESVDGTQNRGVIAFESLDLDRTLITLTMEYEPEGFLERAGDALGIPSSQVEGNLKRFRDFIERREMENGSWDNQHDENVANGDRTGVIGSEPLSTNPAHSEEIVAPTKEEAKIAKSQSLGHSSLLSEHPAIEPLPEEANLASIHAEQEEATGKPQPVGHSSLLSTAPATGSFSEEPALSSVAKTGEGHSEFYRDAEVPSPTHEQIAKRAYELYQARGGADGYGREDWLEAERQLKELPPRSTEASGS